MVLNVSKPTCFGSGHVFNSKLISGTFKQFLFCYKLDPKIDQVFHGTQF